jgi:hypothetical protein
MQSILSDYHTTARAYLFCVMGLILIDSFVRMPTNLAILLQKGMLEQTRSETASNGYIEER